MIERRQREGERERKKGRRRDIDDAEKLRFIGILVYLKIFI